VIGAGDCPHCGGDVVFDLHGERGAREDGPGEARSTRKGFLGRLFGR
jgi:hypothetical protein